MAGPIITYNPPVGKPPRQRAIREARALLISETIRAQKLLAEEAIRQRKEMVIQAAFCVSEGLIVRVLQKVLPPELGPNSFAAACEKAKEAFEAQGWKVYTYSDPPPSAVKNREPLRRLSELLDSPHLGGSFRTSLRALLATIDDLHDNMTANEKRNFRDRTPPPVISYALTKDLELVEIL